MTGTLEANSSLPQRLRLLHNATLLRKLANTNLLRTEATHKAQQDKLVRLEATFAPNNYVSMKQPAVTTSPADFLAEEG